jgi:hypothetical protein
MGEGSSRGGGSSVGGSLGQLSRGGGSSVGGSLGGGELGVGGSIARTFPPDGGVVTGNVPFRPNRLKKLEERDIIPDIREPSRTVCTHHTD